MSWWQIGFHLTSTGNMDGIGGYIQALRDNDKPVSLQSVDSAGVIYEATQAGSHPQDALVFRRASGTDPNTNTKIDRLPESNETYIGDPTQIAASRWSLLMDMWPPELDGSTVWTVSINEPSKEPQNFSYLAQYALEEARLAIAQNKKVLSFGFSGGTPSREFWESPDVLEYLRLAAQYPNNVGVSLHEYSFDGNSLKTGYPYLLGRFQDLHDICDQNGINRPTIIVGEFGAGENEWLGDVNHKMSDIQWAQDLYEHYDNVLGVCCWTLGSWGGTIVDDVLSLVQPITDVAKNYPYSPPDEIEPVEPPVNTPKIVIVKKPQIDRMTFEENIEVSEWAWGEYGRTTCHSTDDMLSMLRSGNSESYAILWWSERQQGVIDTLIEEGFNYILMPEEPEPPLFNPIMQYRPSNTQRITQGFMANPQNYQMWNPPGHMGVDLGVAAGHPFYCTQDGVVVHASNTMWSSNNISAYGYHVVVDHGTFRTLYAHAQSNLPVSVGQSVNAGDIVGLSGNTGNSTGYHLHYSIMTDDITEYHRTTYGSFIDPTYVVSLGVPDTTPPVEPPPSSGNVDVGSFMKADPYCFRVLRHSSGAGEDIQDMDLGNGLWVRRKGSNAEWWKMDSNYAYLVHDTSPSPQTDGTERIYTLTTNGVVGSKKNPLKMSLNQRWVEPSSHHVQFKAKSDCRDLSENSGSATNYATLVKHEFNKVFNTYGQNITLDEFIEIETSHQEYQGYAKHDGKVIGWCSWRSPWGSSEITELYWDRDKLETEPNRYCDFS